MQLLIVTQKINKKDENLGFFHRWVEEFAKHYSRVVVIANSIGEHNLPKNVAVFSLGKDRKSGRLKRYCRFWELFSYHHARSEAVFFHMSPEFVLAASPFLLSMSRPRALWYTHKSITWRLRMAERLVDYVFTASDLSFRLPSKKVIYTGHAIDTDLFRPADQSRPTTSHLRLLTVGRISPIKDLETVVRALAVLKKSWNHPWVLSIVGGPLIERDHGYLAILKKLIWERGLGQRIVFEGARPYTELPEIYREHDIFLSMSATGAVDKSILEAMSSGLSVITANESFSSILSPPYFLEKRSPEVLAERIKTLALENRPNIALRNLVSERHDLKKTIRTIAETLKTNL